MRNNANDIFSLGLEPRVIIGFMEGSNEDGVFTKLFDDIMHGETIAQATNIRLVSPFEKIFMIDAKIYYKMYNNRKLYLKSEEN